MEMQNLVQVFEQSIKDNWNLPALSDYKGETLTYGEAGKEIIKLHSLFSHCVKPGDKIALLGRNSTHWAVTYLAAITYGATIVPILPDFHKNDITNIVNHSDAVLLFVGSQMLGSLDVGKYTNIHGVIKIDDFSVISEKKKYKIGQACEDVLQEAESISISIDNFKFPKVENSSLGSINYTSGTTGFSKGVMLSIASLMSNVEFAENNMNINAGDTMLSILPMAHAYGCAFEFLWPFTKGVHITFMGKTVSPQIMVEAFKDIKPALILMVPLIIEKIYKKKVLPVINKPLMKVLMKLPIINKIIFKKFHSALIDVFGDNFREIVIGGAALNKDVELFLRKIKFKFSVGYGMTECGPLISYAGWNKTKFGSCGILVDRLEMMIDSPDSGNVPGEILVRGIQVMDGYYKNPEATSQAIDEDGWLHTGDLGVTNNDGFIFIRGRSKSLILGASGENIYPEEIEAKLNNLPYVHEQVVIEKQKKLVALVFPDIVEVQKHGISDAELVKVMEDNRRILNENLPKYSQVAEIKIHNTEFEKTPKLSIKRFMYS